MKQTSKFLSLVLRHQPGRIGIELDNQGWIDIETLLAKAAEHGTQITALELQKIVAENDKKRFTFSGDGTRIRAAQGHSVAVDLGITPSCPPDVLYHGTASQNLDAIRAKGLVPGSRQQVHLSSDAQTARKVGQRHGKPHVLLVAAKEMQANGLLFYQSENGVWLTDHVPAVYLSGFDT